VEVLRQPPQDVHSQLANQRSKEGQVAARKKTARKTTRKKASGRKAAKKKTTRKKARTGRRGLDALEKELAGLSKSIDKSLAPLRKEIDKAERQAGTEGARLLREARRRINQLEIKGHSDFTQFLLRSRRDLSSALTGLEKSVRPKRKATKKKTTRKKKA